MFKRGIAVLKLWGRRVTANVQKVTWCIAELGIPFEHDEVGVEGTTPRDVAYLGGKSATAIPMIDDDGFVLWEGNAIARYLATKYPDRGLLPMDPKRRAETEAWMDYQLSTARVPIHALMRDQLDRSEIEFHSRELTKIMQVVEVTLADRPYLMGSEFTLADIPLGIVTYRWFILDIERPSAPNIEAWFDRLSARPAFREWIFPPEEAIVPIRGEAKQA